MDHATCARLRRASASAPATANQTMPAADVGTAVPAITAYPLPRTRSQLIAPPTVHTSCAAEKWTKVR